MVSLHCVWGFIWTDIALLDRILCCDELGTSNSIHDTILRCEPLFVSSKQHNLRMIKEPFFLSALVVFLYPTFACIWVIYARFRQCNSDSDILTNTLMISTSSQN
jgi:hypothetical protein